MPSKIVTLPRSKSPAAPVRKKAIPAAKAPPPPATPTRPVRRTPGRTRSDASRVAILNAALKLLKTNTLQQITIEAIAREAEVGKATIYRWWPSKASVVIDAFMQNHIVQTPMPSGLSGREALTQHMHLLVEQYRGWPGTLVAQILAEGQADPQVLKEFQERFFRGRRAVVRGVLEEGRRRGEFRTDMDIDLQADILYAPIYFRLMMQHQPLDKAFAGVLSDIVLSLLTTPAPGVKKGTRRA